MPDNSASIANLTAAINSGATSATVDGQTATFRSLAEMRAIRQNLIDADTSGDYASEKRRRPRSGQINLGGAW